MYINVIMHSCFCLIYINYCRPFDGPCWTIHLNNNVETNSQVARMHGKDFSGSAPWRGYFAAYGLPSYSFYYICWRWFGLFFTIIFYHHDLGWFGLFQVSEKQVQDLVTYVTYVRLKRMMAQVFFWKCMFLLIQEDNLRLPIHCQSEKKRRCSKKWRFSCHRFCSHLGVALLVKYVHSESWVDFSICVLLFFLSRTSTWQ